MKAAIVLICAFLMTGTNVLAHGDQVHVLGTVSKIEAGSISIATTNAGEKVVKIVATTKFLKGETVVTLYDLKVGDRVAVHAKPKGETLEATEVKIGIAKPASQSH